MLKKLILCSVFCVLISTYSLSVSSNNHPVKRKNFTDIKWGYWAKGPIELLGGLGIIGGYPDGTFRPGKTITRAELTTLLVKTREGELINVGFTIFSDVAQNHWAAPYIDKAVETEWVKGYPDATFKPNKTVSRAEGVAILARYDGLKLKEPDVPPFPDMPLDHWAVKSIEAAKKAGMLDYLAGRNFDPNRPLTRAEAAEMISKTSFVKNL